MPPVERTHLDQLEKQSIFISGGLSRLQEYRHAIVDGEGFQCSYLARAQVIFRQNPVPRLHIATRSMNFLECWNSGIGQSNITIFNLIVEKLTTETRERRIG
jgi:hypothetical protein